MDIDFDLKKKLDFITANIAIEYLRRSGCSHVGDVIELSKLWPEIESKIIVKLFLDKQIKTYFDNHGGFESVEFKSYLSTAKDIKLTDLAFANLISPNDNHVKYELLVTGKYLSVIEGNDHLDVDSIKLQYIGRELCSAPGLYDPFNFGSDDGISVTLHKNHAMSNSSIDAIITATDAIPFLIVFYKDKSFKRLTINDIVKFVTDELEKNEINYNLADQVKQAYPRLYLPKVTKKAIVEIFDYLTKLITNAYHQAKKYGKPLLLLISEIHDSRDSFLLQAMMLHVAKNLKINNLALETINLHHGDHGFDAPVESTHRLIRFARNELLINVIDLEAELNYMGIKSPYPYHELPEGVLSESFRESSWIHDMNQLGEDTVLIVGTDHMNNLLNSKINQHYYILPINTTADREYSLEKNTADKNLISLEYSTWQYSHDQLLSLSLESNLDGS